MMNAILPDTDIPIKTLTRDRLGEISADVESEPVDGAGAIVIRMNLSGIVGTQILADQSDEEDALRQRLTAARPVLELLQEMFTVDTIGTKAEARRS